MRASLVSLPAFGADMVMLVDHPAAGAAPANSISCQECGHTGFPGDPAVFQQTDGIASAVSAIHVLDQFTRKIGTRKTMRQIPAIGTGLDPASEAGGGFLLLLRTLAARAGVLAAVSCPDMGVTGQAVDTAGGEQGLVNGIWHDHDVVHYSGAGNSRQ